MGPFAAAMSGGMPGGLNLPGGLDLPGLGIGGAAPRREEAGEGDGPRADDPKT
jgi:hypothetical protein